MSIDVKELSKQVALVAARNPNGVNAAPGYFEEDMKTPCCIIGHALADLGQESEVSRVQNGLTILTLVGQDWPVKQKNRFLSFLRHVQVITDEGVGWQTAVIQASRVLLKD